jgi:uncharacterized protein
VTRSSPPEPACTVHPAGPVARVLIRAVRGYQARLSPLKAAPSCRFTPSCSEYAAQAIALHGAVRGSLLAGWRILRCQPFHPGGYDPVPLTAGQRGAVATAQSAAGQTITQPADHTRPAHIHPAPTDASG